MAVVAARDQLFASGSWVKPRPALSDWLSLVASFAHVLSCFEPTFASADMDAILAFFHRLLSWLLQAQATHAKQVSAMPRPSEPELSSVLAALHRSSDTRLASLTDPLIVPSIQLIVRHLASDQQAAVLDEHGHDAAVARFVVLPVWRASECVQSDALAVSWCAAAALPRAILTNRPNHEIQVSCAV